MFADKTRLLKEMSLGATVITPNNRLSNQLLSDYYAHFSPNPDAISKLDKPRCLPYQTFLKQLFNQIQHTVATTVHPNLLTPIQQRHLWRHIISHDASFTCNDGLLSEVQEAYRRCMQWQVDFNHQLFLNTPQTHQFQQWEQQFHSEVLKRAAITEEQLAQYIMTYPAVCHLDTLVWVSFDDYTPEQRSLQALFETEKTRQHHYDLASKPTNTHLYPAKDKLDEYQQMIDWILARLSEGDSRIGIVVPNLQQEAHELQRRLQRHMSTSQFNLSLGKSLLEYPLVAHAMQWLRLNSDVMTNHQARLLLYSPYLSGSKSEFMARSGIIEDSFLLKESLLPIKTLIQELTLKAPNLASLLDSLEPYPTHATPMAWANYFKARLISLGFPGDYALDSSSYQCFQSLLGNLDELMQFAMITPLMSAVEALDALQELAKSTIFQIKKPTTPVQVLGLLEASGCTFDSLWVTGLTDLSMPAKTNFSAFIPIPLQRDFHMPHADALRELKLARQVLARLQNGSQTVVFSYPRMRGDLPHLPCPLIIDFPILDWCRLPVEPVLSSLIPYEEAYQIALTETETIAGGTSLLANQAMCPFKAFAAHRLHARTTSELSEGPDPSERGQVLHRVMELLWTKLQNQANLLLMSSSALNSFIEDIINEALKPIAARRPLSFSQVTQTVELARLKQLVHANIVWEKERAPFVIDALEQTFTIALAGINFRVRIDRLDSIMSSDDTDDDNHHQKMVIDYKSSLPSSKPWNEERPEAPQLLLYALLDEHINALLFVQLKKGRLTCNGLSEYPLPIKGIQSLKKEEQWSDYQEQWRQQLTILATEFKIGLCNPLPTRKNTCIQCEFQNLCRI